MPRKSKPARGHWPEAGDRKTDLGNLHPQYTASSAEGQESIQEHSFCGFDYRSLPFDCSPPPREAVLRGGRIAWAVEDAMFGLLAELRARGLLADDPEGITASVSAAWCRLSRDASYPFPSRLRRWAVELWQAWEEMQP